MPPPEAGVQPAAPSSEHQRQLVVGEDRIRRHDAQALHPGLSDELVIEGIAVV